MRCLTAQRDRPTIHAVTRSDRSISAGRRLVRSALRPLIHVAFALLSELHIEGTEHVPRSGPLLVVANHFSFLDPLAMIRATPRPLEFVGGFRMPNAPALVRWIPRLWGYYPVYRGTASRDGLRAASAHLASGGALGVFPEGGNWATVLRPARPGAAFLASETGSIIVPMGLHGFTDVFRCLRRGQRARVVVRIGQPFGPLRASGVGRVRRQQLDEFGHEMMRRIAALIPAGERGFYAEDPATRAAALGTERYPFDERPDRL